MPMKVYNHPSYSYVKVVEVDVADVDKFEFATCAQPRETLGSFYNRQAVKPDVLINAGFFNMADGVPCFNFIDDGIAKAKLSTVTAGIGVTKENPNKPIFGLVGSKNWKDFISGFPVLLDGTGPMTKWNYANEINYSATRSMLGMNKDYSKIFIVAISKPGMAFAAMSKLMHGLGCFVAINLDGGGSTRLMVSGKVANTPTENRSVDNVVAVWLKKSSTTNTPIKTPEVTTPYISYIAKSGDSWWKIATSYLGAGSRYSEILSFNGLAANAALVVGQTVKIPTKEVTYTVKSGDSLWSIATSQLGSGPRYTVLAKYNNMDVNAAIHAGDVLKIPV